MFTIPDGWLEEFTSLESRLTVCQLFALQQATVEGIGLRSKNPDRAVADREEAQLAELVALGLLEIAGTCTWGVFLEPTAKGEAALKFWSDAIMEVR